MTKLIYTAEATVAGGREHGHGVTSDGVLDVQLRIPGADGDGTPGTNPEQLFAVGYAACFEQALIAEARKARVTHEVIAGLSIDAKVLLYMDDDFNATIAPELHVTLPDVDEELAAQVVGRAHQRCPYSKAIRGNVDVTLTVNGKALADA
jgi:osmotically inducible protein OsmC